MVKNLIINIKSNPRKKYVLNNFRELLLKYKHFDSEEQDRICSYLEEIMDIVGIKNSDGLLNKWQYGFLKRFFT